MTTQILTAQDNEDLRIANHFYSGAERGTVQAFAQDIPTEISTTTHGRWESTADGLMVWRHRIISRDAYSLNIECSELHLPSSATLFLYDTDQQYVIGPLSAQGLEQHTQWWSPIIPGDELIIEIQVSPKQMDQVQLLISKVNHDFSGFGAVLSGSCNLDVICGGDDGYGIVDRWRSQINSVGRMTIDGRFNCTGALINNTRRDCTPYVLTAEHCGITGSNAASVVIYWNYQNSTCRTPNSAVSGAPGDGPLIQFNSGSKLVASFDRSDFALIELTDPVDISISPYLAGWDLAESASTDSVFAIHHPGGEEKRISFDYDPVSFRVDRNYVRVHDWDVGTTERGSSGCPLFNKKGLVIGHLSGGEAACGVNAYDDFGMFLRSWEGGGTPGTRLSDWLDPIASGQRSLTGRFCRDVVLLSQNKVTLCAARPRDTITITATQGYPSPTSISAVAPAGVMVTLSQQTITNGESLSIYIEVDPALIDTEQEVQLLLESEDGQATEIFTIDIDHDTPSTPLLVSPANDARGLNFGIAFEWQSDGRQYLIEVSDHRDFSQLFASVTTSDPMATIKNFLPSTTYYWRVVADNSCGASGYSEVFQFTTGEIACRTVSSTAVPKDIPLVPATILSTIEVQDIGTVADVNVPEIVIQHTYLGDLTITLRSPAGTDVTLLDTSCDELDNMRAGFDDESELINLDCPLTTGRIFRPVTPLSALIGESVTGVWTLIIEDNAHEDGGTLSAWSLDLCIQGAPGRTITIDPTSLNLCQKDPNPIDLLVTLNEAWEDPESVQVTTSGGTLLVSQNLNGDQNQFNLTIDVSSSIVSSSHLTVTVYDDMVQVSQDVSISLIIDVDSPLLVRPHDGAEMIPPEESLLWSSPQSDIDYHLVVSRQPDLSQPDIDTVVSDVSYLPDPPLVELSQYYWQVTAIGMCSDMPSEISSFQTDKKVDTDRTILDMVEVQRTLTEDYIKVVVPPQLSPDFRQYWIYDLSGRLLRHVGITQDVTFIPVTSLSSGTYMIKIGQPRDHLVKRFIKL